jgi:membrane associated rhomboid family serine protease
VIVPLRDNAPSYTTPVVTITLILVNFLAFGLQWAYPGGFEQSIYDWGEVPTRILAGQPVPGTNISSSWTMLTSMFLHGGFLHIIFNMIALWLFGDNVEWLLGRAKYLLFYLACGLTASGFTVVFGYESGLPGVGASGAIAGVMAAYLIFYPRAKITSLVWFGFLSWGYYYSGRWGPHLRYISALWFIGSWVAFEVIYAVLYMTEGVHVNLGTYAHAMGAIAGAVFVWPLVIRARIPPRSASVRCAELTLPIFGDEGDAPIAEYELSPEALETLPDQKPKAISEFPFCDHILDDLLEQGDVAGALRHAREMLGIARSQDNRHRAKGYEEAIRRLEVSTARQQGWVKPRTLELDDD